MRRLPILTFHSIDVSGSVISVSPADFTAHINTLALEGWQSCAVSQVLRWRQAGDLPRRTVAITFDDGYRSVYEAALPVLRDHGFTATVFVTAGRCGSDNRWLGQPAQIPTWPMLSWDEVRALSREGWEIGAHGITHRPLTSVDSDEAMQEIKASRQILSERAGSDVLSFAYPYGAHDEAVRALVRQVYHGACGTRMDYVRANSDPFSLPRIDAYYLGRWLSPTRLETPRGRLYVMLRRVGRRIRRLRATHAKDAPEYT